MDHSIRFLLSIGVNLIGMVMGDIIIVACGIVMVICAWVMYLTDKKQDEES